MADIQAMFHQVKVTSKDINFLRFLWWPEGDIEQVLVEYRMTVHLFGAVSSPSCANYALRKNAEDNQSHFSSEVVSTIKCNFYVDDCLKSLSSEEEAVQMVQDLIHLCQKGGFNLSKWVSNSSTVLASIPVENRAHEIKEFDLDKERLQLERALGLQWFVHTDEFKFRITPQEQPQTRRGILSVVSSLYDPLGFLSPFTLLAKFMLQDLCKRKYGWDEKIPQSFSQRWSVWQQGLEKIGEFKADRCFKPKGFGNLVNAELHHFSDASQEGYGTVSFLRLKNTDNQLHVAFIFGKARVAPLKQVTIPRMELTAAVLAVRVDRMLQKELQLPLQGSTFWTDSTTVLKYLSNETSRFHTFVANRIATIREATEVEQWRYIGSKENPADEASRGMKAENFLENKRWIQGPEFLSKSEDRWPKSDMDLSVISSDDPEVKRNLVVNSIIKDAENPTNYLIHYFSNWIKLKTAVAWFLKLKKLLKLLNEKRKEIQADFSITEKDPEKQRTVLE